MSMAGRNIVVLGPPGSGKGTQAARFAGELGLEHISTGDLLRDAVKGKTELGEKAYRYMEKGLLVPDEIMLGLIEEKLATLDSKGWVLDGFPRTLPQAEALSALLEGSGQKIEKVLLIDVNPEIIVNRLSSRRVCPQCNAVYNLNTIRTAVEGVCDACGGKLVRRPDDEEETIRRRLDVYEEQTAPLISYYREYDDLVTVNGSGGIEEINAEILRVLR
jgi:adenylate kinase